MLVRFTTVFVCVFLVQAKIPKLGAWKGIINEVGHCITPQYKDLTQSFKIDIQKKGKFGRFVTNGSFILPIGLMDDHEMAVTVNEFKNDKWHSIVNHNVGTACRAFNTYWPLGCRLLIDSLENATVSKHGDDYCISSKGEFALRPFDLPPAEMQDIPKFFYGDYVIELISFHPNATKLSCTAFHVSVVSPDDMKGSGKKETRT